MEVIMININLVNQIYSVDLEINCYGDEHARPAISLKGAEGSLYEYEPIARATVNIPEFNEEMRRSGAFSNLDEMDDRTFNNERIITEDHPWTFIKDYSENEGMLQQLVDNGIVEDLYTRVACGFSYADLVLIQDKDLVAQWEEQKAAVDKKRAMETYRSIVTSIKESHK